MNTLAVIPRRPLACLFALLLLALAVPVAHRASAGLPLPSITFYGLFLDIYGWPYPEGHVVEIRSEGQRVASRSLSSAAGKDYNFIVRLPYDSGGELDDYAAGTLGFGSDVEVRVTDPAGRTILSTNFIVRLPAGAVVNINGASGSDTLGDGLPDELRRWIWAADGLSLAFNPSAYRASDDSDGDGVSNLAEYLAGTDPANPEDVLALAIQPTSDSASVQLSFFSVPGKTYRVQTGEVQAAGVTWLDAPFARSPGARPDTLNAPGTGRWLSLFVDASPSSRLYRVTVLPQPRGSRLLP
jgi:hypothetical protein